MDWTDYEGPESDNGIMRYVDSKSGIVLTDEKVQ
jgi:hypothetical protein